MMKYRILPSLLLALLISSCSSSGQDDTALPEPTPTPSPKPEPQQVGINFGGSSGAWQDAPASRAGKAGLETLFPSFRIWGYKSTDANTLALQTVMEGYNVLHTSTSSGSDDASGSSSSNTDDWEYVGLSNTALNTTQTIKYWDYSATSYRFLGYTQDAINETKVTSTYQNFGTSNNNTSTENTDAADAGDTNTAPIQTFSIPYSYSEQATEKTTPYLSELWFSKSPTTSGNTDSSSSSEGETSSSNYGKSVTLTFAPVIAKVRFKFTYPDGIKNINIKDIQFCDSRYQADSSTDNTPSADATADTPLKGTISAKYSLGETSTNSYPELSWNTSTAENSKGKLIFTIPYEEENATIHITPNVSEYSKWYYCPPYASFASTDGTAGAYEQGSYTITARIEGNHSSATVPNEYMQWKAGYQYTYTFKITEAGTTITFADLKVEQWQTAPNTDNNGSGTAGW